MAIGRRWCPRCQQQVFVVRHVYHRMNEKSEEVRCNQCNLTLEIHHYPKVRLWEK